MNAYRAREMLVEQLQKQGITNQHVLNAFKRVPREEFVTKEYKDRAYQNSPIPIGNEQTTSQPYTIALMMQLLDPSPGHTVLEIGTGTGYQSSLLSQIVKKVYTVERIHELAEVARKIHSRLLYRDITVVEGDGTCGYEEGGPYDRIIVTAGAPEVPEPLLNQLKQNGILVIPVGSFWDHSLVKIKKVGNSFEREEYPGFMFVPLIGECGWEDYA